MPTRSPSYDLGPEVPASASAIFGRTVQEFERLPVVQHLQSTASLTLTTSPTLVPSLLTSVAVPGNAYICVDVTLEVYSSVVDVVAVLLNQPPGQTLTSNGSSASIVLSPSAAPWRGPLTQRWTFLTPTPGVWHFQMQAFRGAASTDAMVQSINSNMRVMVL